MAAAAVQGAAALTLTPGGRVKSVLRAVCGLVLLIAMLSPLLGLTAGNVTVDISRYREEADRIAGDAEKNAGELNRTIIEDRLETYIRDKAAALGVEDFEVELTARWAGKENCWRPFKAVMSGCPTPMQRSLLGAFLEAELGVISENQSWEENGEQ